MPFEICTKTRGAKAFKGHTPSSTNPPVFGVRMHQASTLQWGGGASQAQGDWDELQLHLLCGEDQHQAAWHSPAESQDLSLHLVKSYSAYTHVDKK